MAITLSVVDEVGLRIEESRGVENWRAETDYVARGF